MITQDRIVSGVRRLLPDFLLPLLAVVDKPRKRFLRQAVASILLAGSLCIKDMARWIRDDCSDVFYRIKRLTRHLASSHGDLAPAVTAYRAACGRYIQADTPLLIDLTDVAKPRARKMPYLSLVYDGSEDRLVNGYWCLEVYAQLPRKRILPLALDLFSIDDPAVGSRNLQIHRTVRALHQALNGKGIWIADCGFDGLDVYETWFSLRAHFVVRQRGDRHVVTDHGIHLTELHLLEHLRQRQMHQHQQTQLVWTRVHLPKRNEPLYLVASWKTGCDRPLIVLTTLVIETLPQARQIMGYYRQRWTCEEAGRFLKNRIGLERFCVRRYEAVQRLMLLAMFAMGFLTWMLLRSRRLIRAMLTMTSRFRKPCPFVYYRLLDGFQQFARQHRKLASEIPIPAFENG